MPMLTISCNPQNEPTDEPGIDTDTIVTIIGNWEVVNAFYSIDNQPTGDSSEKGQVWKLDEEGNLMVDGKTYGYELSGDKLTTSYAAIYNSQYFTVKNLLKDSMTLSVSYENVTKVGKQTITVTLDFKRKD